jgi:hypothetical protein
VSLGWMQLIEEARAVIEEAEESIMKILRALEGDYNLQIIGIELHHKLTIGCFQPKVETLKIHAEV